MRVRDPELLRAAIVERRLTQAQVALLAGCSQSFISHLVPGRRVPGSRPRKRGCTPGMAAAIARALNRPTDELFALVGPDEPSAGAIVLQR